MQINNKMKDNSLITYLRNTLVLSEAEGIHKIKIRRKIKTLFEKNK